GARLTARSRGTQMYRRRRARRGTSSSSTNGWTSDRHIRPCARSTGAGCASQLPPSNPTVTHGSSQIAGRARSTGAQGAKRGSKTRRDRGVGETMRSRRIAPALLLGWLVLVATGSMRRAGAEESAGDLDTLVAPIALYPDALLADILPASTYPVQVVEAARAVGHGGQVDPSQASQWDASVRALIAFPSVLAMMDDRIEWTTRLGQAVA